MPFMQQQLYCFSSVCLGRQTYRVQFTVLQELGSLWHLFRLEFKPTGPAADVFGVPLVFLSFVELSTVCLESLAIFTQLKFDIGHPL
jgi:hypothetical protein